MRIRLIGAILIVLLGLGLFAPLATSAYKTGDTYKYITTISREAIYNGTSLASYETNMVYTYKIINYNSTDHKIEFYLTYSSMMGAFIQSVLSYNTSTNDIKFFGSMVDADLDNYYNVIDMYPTLYGPFFDNSSRVLEMLNNTFKWFVGNRSHMALKSSHYDLVSRTFNGVATIPVDLLFVLPSGSEQFTGILKATVSVSINNDNVLNNINVNIKGNLVNPTHGNISYTQINNIELYGGSSTTGFSLSSLLGSNSLATMAIVGVVALVIGVAIGRKH